MKAHCLQARFIIPHSQDLSIAIFLPNVHPTHPGLKTARSTVFDRGKIQQNPFYSPASVEKTGKPGVRGRFCTVFHIQKQLWLEGFPSSHSCLISKCSASVGARLGLTAYSNSTTCVQRVRNSFSAPCFLVICAAATIGSHFWTYCIAISFFLQKSLRYRSAFF